jgi:hypothetical protein
MQPIHAKLGLALRSPLLENPEEPMQLLDFLLPRLDLALEKKDFPLQRLHTGCEKCVELLLLLSHTLNCHLPVLTLKGTGTHLAVLRSETRTGRHAHRVYAHVRSLTEGVFVFGLRGFGDDLFRGFYFGFATR